MGRAQRYPSCGTSVALHSVWKLGGYWRESSSAAIPAACDPAPALGFSRRSHHSGAPERDASGLLWVVNSTHCATSTLTRGAPRGKSRSIPARRDSAWRSRRRCTLFVRRYNLRGNSHSLTNNDIAYHWSGTTMINSLRMQQETSHGAPEERTVVIPEDRC